MGNRKLFIKSVAIVLVMIAGLTATPLKSYGDTIENEQSHATETQSSTNTGLIIGGVAAVGLLVYFVFIRDHNRKATASSGNSYSNGSHICLSDKEHRNKSLLIDHESPYFLTAQSDSKSD